MKVSGFTFVRNALNYDYPIIEVISSILPLCDEVIVAVGNSEDDTLELIKSIQTDKIKIIETIWDDSLREGGKVLAAETNKAFSAISADADWAFYIQADEIIHEDDYEAIRQGMERNLTNEKVDGLLFKYRHFYGSYKYLGSSLNWYPHEIRIIRNRKDIYSYKDAQGFRKGNNEKLMVDVLNAYVYHYGWVKKPDAMQAKQQYFQKLWHDDAEVVRRVGSWDKYKYEKNKHVLVPFHGTHPAIMQKRIQQANWEFKYKRGIRYHALKGGFKLFCKKYLGLDLGYRNYRELR